MFYFLGVDRLLFIVEKSFTFIGLLEINLLKLHHFKRS